MRFVLIVFHITFFSIFFHLFLQKFYKLLFALEKMFLWLQFFQLTLFCCSVNQALHSLFFDYTYSWSSQHQFTPQYPSPHLTEKLLENLAWNPLTGDSFSSCLLTLRLFISLNLNVVAFLESYSCLRLSYLCLHNLLTLSFFLFLPLKHHII